MPCILKQATPSSPGIITFTHNEALRGLPAQSQQLKEHLLESSRSGSWVYGIHVQGDLSHLSAWSWEEWQSFIMWPDRTARFLASIPPEKIVELNCVNFLPAPPGTPRPEPMWDICLISRPSSIKRIDESLQIMRRLLDARPTTEFVLMVPDYRDFTLGEAAFELQGIDPRFFKRPRELFSAKELEQISFISPSTQAFGNFPVSHKLVIDILRRSRFLLLTSHAEGTPRSVGEALLVGTPCIISRSLRSGVNFLLGVENSVRIDDDVKRSADQILDALDGYGRFQIDVRESRLLFSAESNVPRLKERLSTLVRSQGHGVEGDWYLDHLHLRLCGHGAKFDFQFMDDDTRRFFAWLESTLRAGPYREEVFESLFGSRGRAGGAGPTGRADPRKGRRQDSSTKGRLAGAARAIKRRVQGSLRFR